MLPRGRPPGPGTAEEKAAIRREKVRLNVKAYRERKKKAQAVLSRTSSISSDSQSDTVGSNASSDHSLSGRRGFSSSDDNEDDQHELVIHSGSQPISTRRSSELKTQSKAQFGDTLFSSPDSGPIFSQAFLSVFRCAFLPSNLYLPREDLGGSSLVTPCSTWILNAYQMAMDQDSGALKSGLAAVGLILSGAQNGSSELKVASLQMHRQALGQLRKDLGPITLHGQSRRSAANGLIPYLSCLAVTMFEIVQTGFSPNILQHIKALTSLIELLYADPDVDRFTADLILEDFGMLEMILCLKFGFNSILRHTRRRLAVHGLRPVSDGKSNASVFGDLLDIVEEMPSLVGKLKPLRNSLNLRTSFDDLRQIIRKLFRIQGDLDAWNIEFEIRHGSIRNQDTYFSNTPGAKGTTPVLRSYEHGSVGLYMLWFCMCAVESNIEAMTMLVQMQQAPVTQMSPSIPNDFAGFAMEAQDFELVTEHVELDFAKPGIPVVELGSSLLYQQLKSQRTKVRSILKQLVDVIDQFSLLATNFSGQSFLIAPCDWIRRVLDKERSRLQYDLQRLRAGDHEGAIEINNHLKDFEETGDFFKAVEQRLQQHHDYGIMHGG